MLPSGAFFLTKCCFVIICYCTVLFVAFAFVHYPCILYCFILSFRGARLQAQPLCNPCHLTKIDNNNKARQVNVFLRRNVYQCPPHVKCNLYT